MADARIDFLNTMDFFKLPNIPYDSDHNAAMALVKNTKQREYPMR